MQKNSSLELNQDLYKYGVHQLTKKKL
jgi:hypothetical protein